MEINRSSVTLLAAISLTAGAAGAYLVTRGLPGQDTPLAAVTDARVADSPPEPTSPLTPSVGSSVASPTPADRQRTTRMLRPQAVRPVAPEAEPVVPPPALAVSNPPAVSDEPVTVSAMPLEPVRVVEPVAPIVEPTGPQYDELVVSADSVVGLEMETSVSSEMARVEDAVRARVARDVRVGDRIAIPAGSRVEGEVVTVERGGRLRERARLGVQFTSILTPDGTRLPIHTEVVFREGASQGRASASKIGGAALGGAIIGGILGGGKGAAIGGSLGAGAGSAAVLAGGRNPATLSSGTLVTVRLEDPVVVTVER